MKLLLLVAGALAASTALGIIQPADWLETYRQLYPSDPEQRRALEQCFTLDAQFNRLDPNERTACYRHYASSVAPSNSGPINSGTASNGISGAVPGAPTGSRPPAANFVDLWKSAGQGHLSQSDVRAEQQNDRFVHPQAVNNFR
jgi:hypothetical protein